MEISTVTVAPLSSLLHRVLNGSAVLYRQIDYDEDDNPYATDADIEAAAVAADQQHQQQQRAGGVPYVVPSLRVEAATTISGTDCIIAMLQSCSSLSRVTLSRHMLHNGDRDTASNNHHMHMHVPACAAAVVLPSQMNRFVARLERDVSTMDRDVTIMMT